MVFEKRQKEEAAKNGPQAWDAFTGDQISERVYNAVRGDKMMHSLAAMEASYFMGKPLKNGDEVQFTYTLTIAAPDGSQDMAMAAHLNNTHLEWVDFDPEDLQVANQKDDEMRAIMNARGSDFVNRTVEIDPLSLVARAFYTSVCPGGCDHD